MYRVFSRPGYFVFAIAIAIAVFALIAWWGAIPLLVRVVAEIGIPFDRALTLAATLLYSSFFNFNAHAFTSAALTSILIGVNGALLSFYFRMYRAVPSSAAAVTGIMGSLAALLGFGCAACGSIFLVSVVGTLGGSVLANLPYGGEEIGYIGIALLTISALFLARAINTPRVCPI